MLQCAKKYGVSFDTVNPSPQILGQLPLWHHFGQDPNKMQRNNSASCKCLQANHDVWLVHEGLVMLRRLRDEEQKPTPTCKCLACSEDRHVRSCNNPHVCTSAVERRLSSLLPK
ncbi:hypothetical protein B0H17DRAFT_928743 [Mycena rosella]|uniref:Uncharacterized protein n=1 Tax=Mycena rosella TaxID=1033263 RepID=A0AAD7DQ35_MYCRO|nr:hypothetical protein B0H17DRAFT_928743 [Mycena rosella]